MRTQARRCSTCHLATASKQLKGWAWCRAKKSPQLHMEEPKSQFSKSAFTTSQRSLLVTSFISLSKIHTSVVWNSITFSKCGLAWNLTVKESWLNVKSSWFRWSRPRAGGAQPRSVHRSTRLLRWALFSLRDQDISARAEGLGASFCDF